MTTEFLPYDPGPLPSRPPPSPGDSIIFEVDGWPPWKDVHFSIRNPRHRDYESFVSLRKAAIHSMAGRAWYRGPVHLHLELRFPPTERPRSLLDYAGGIGDTLDGSHGLTFTYLPIVFEDDSQIRSAEWHAVDAKEPSYRVHVQFLEEKPPMSGDDRK